MSPGRPTVLTPDARTKILGYIADGLSIEDACSLVGIHKSTYFEAQDRARSRPRADPELTDFFDRDVPKARVARRAIAQGILSDSLRPDVPEEIRRNVAFRILLLDAKMEALRLKKKELEQGTKVEHSGSVGITPERRAWLEELRKDPEAVRLAVELGSRMQPYRLAAMGLKPNQRGSASAVVPAP